jgi:glucosamine--fructose-6-phosphate aminotransferase (isomerizing)
MCGIVGYTGFRNAKNIVLDGLAALEYRGYDSAGLALGGAALSVFKCGGRVSELEREIPDIGAPLGIGHTRWATHGKPVAKNAHPHLSFDGKIAIVHNGIVENSDELRAYLANLGITPVSDTDSELIAHLLALEFNESGDMLKAAEQVAKKLDGAASFLAVREGDRNIYCRRYGASLAVGLGINENFVASDTLALGKYTREIMVLNDGEFAVISPEAVNVYKNGCPIQKEVLNFRRERPIECKCHMREEIDEIPSALLRTYESFLKSVGDSVLRRIESKTRVYLTGCGTAFHACLYGKEIIERVAKIPCEVYIASEFSKARFIDSQSLVVLISQSGETADTLIALEASKQRGALTLAITNVEGSSISFGADITLLLDAGAEVAVAATKSYDSQLLALYLLANRLAGETVGIDAVKALCGAIEDVKDADMFDSSFKCANLFFVGKGIDEITAREGALKFKEITYRMTDAYPAGELKHGTIALIDPSAVIVVAATENAEKQRMQAAVSELRSRGAFTIALSAVGDIGADKTLSLPRLNDPLLYPLLSVVPLQALALETSLSLGLDPDKPRNLAKSVTVI